MVIPILTVPDKRLYEKSVQVVSIGDSIIPLLVRHLSDTVLAHNGLGLAAPQIGCLLRIFVLIDSTGKPYPVLNPVLLYHERRCHLPEQCLSVPGIQVEKVPRYFVIKVQYENLAGLTVKRTLAGNSAIVFQHELDHLDGILIGHKNG